NLPEEAIAAQEDKLVTGIYYGWAQVVVRTAPESHTAITHDTPSSKSAEVHIMHNFHRDFYGDELRVVVLGYIRPELDYTTLDALIEDINIDIEVAHRSLERPAYAAFKEDPLFLQL
ncbi:riboflavin kinase, partial [Linnemannia elongata]